MPLSLEEAQEALQRALCITETLTPAGLMDRAARLIEAMRANCNGRASVIDGCHLTIASLQLLLEEAQTRLTAVARQRDVRDSILTAITQAVQSAPAGTDLTATVQALMMPLHPGPLAWPADGGPPVEVRPC